MPQLYRITATAHHDDSDQNVLSWPSMCACCLEPAGGDEWLDARKTTWSQVYGSIVTWSHGWRVPYCRRCRTHYRYFDHIPDFGAGTSVLTTLSGLGGFLIAGVARSLTVDFVVGDLIFIAVPIALTALVAKIRRLQARKAIRPSCSSRAAAVCYEGEALRELPEWVRWRSRHKFTFTNQEYARAFARSNEGTWRS